MLFKYQPRMAAAAAAVLAAVVLSGCGDKSAQTAQAQQQAPLTQVAVTEMKLDNAVIRAELSGRTTAYQVAEVRPQVSGIIEKRQFEEGAEVQAGQSLYQIDPSIYEAQVNSAAASLKQAEASLALARADAKRSAVLVKTKAVSQSSDDQAQAQLKVAEANVASAKAALDTARINLKYTQVKSPITGQVSLSEVTPGALVTANQASRLTVVQQLDPIYVDVTQSYDTMDKIRSSFKDGKLAEGGSEAEVELILDNGATYAHKGKLTFKDALVNETTGTVRIRAVFPNPERRLMPGQYVRAVINEGVRKDVIKLDQRATMRRTNGNPYVYVLTADNKVETRDIVTSGTEGAYWLVESGLKVGERVVVEGVLKIRPGQTVAPVAAGAQPQKTNTLAK